MCDCCVSHRCVCVCVCIAATKVWNSNVSDWNRFFRSHVRVNGCSLKQPVDILHICLNSVNPTLSCCFYCHVISQGCRGDSGMVGELPVSAGFPSSSLGGHSSHQSCSVSQRLVFQGQTEGTILSPLTDNTDTWHLALPIQVTADRWSGSQIGPIVKPDRHTSVSDLTVNCI